jgi:hypothetical protein
VNIAWKTKCYISKSKLILCEYNAFYYSEIAFIDFTLHEIKQGIVFLGTPGSYVNSSLEEMSSKACLCLRPKSQTLQQRFFL